jgi:DNA-binding GntR family transcriptional regulator
MPFLLDATGSKPGRDGGEVLGKISDEVYNVLRRRIMTGAFVPHTKIKEIDVAGELGVSRTPVRSALQRLVADALLRPAPKRGAMTVEWTDRDIGEIFELRTALEGMAAAHAARHRSEEALGELAAFTDEMAALWSSRPTDYLARIQAANSRFHRTILTQSRCPHARELAHNLMAVPIVIGGFYLYSDADMARSVQQHRDVIDALTTRNSRWARRAMENHLMSSHQVFVRAKRASGLPGRDGSAE